MIKGINKRIIEIKDINSKYFSSALLFVNPVQDSSDDKKLTEEADRILSKYGEAMGSIPKTPKRKIKKQYPICFISGAAVGFIIAFITSKFI